MEQPITFAEMLEAIEAARGTVMDSHSGWSTSVVRADKLIAALHQLHRKRVAGSEVPPEPPQYR